MNPPMILVWYFSRTKCPARFFAWMKPDIRIDSTGEWLLAVRTMLSTLLLRYVEREESAASGRGRISIPPELRPEIMQSR